LDTSGFDNSNSNETYDFNNIDLPPKHNSKHDQMLDLLKLNSQAISPIEPSFAHLLQLGYAGQVETQQVFVKALYYAVTKTAESGDNELYLQNRINLFSSARGRDVLTRLIISSTWEDMETAADAKKALRNICENFSGRSSC
jgi:hypothetical protein